MQKTTILTLLICIAGLSGIKSQNFLDGVYVREFVVRNGDTLETVIKGKVLSKETWKPLSNIRVAYVASNGQNVGVYTNQNGDFRISGLPSDNVNAKVICSDTLYKKIVWEFNTYGISQPRIFNFNFELEKTDK